MQRLMPVLLCSCLLLSGCDPEPEVDPTPAAPSKAELEAIEQNRKGYEAKQAEFKLKVSNEVRLRRRSGILKLLGPVKSWHVSTERNGKVDDELVKQVQSGNVDNSLNEAFSHRGLKLKNFLHLPKAIAALRKSNPRPESCDFICAEPPEFDELKELFGAGLIISDDTDPKGNPRKWYRDKELSLGVVDNRVEVVRVHVNAKTFDWQVVRTMR